MEHPEKRKNTKTQMERTDLSVADIQYGYFFAYQRLCVQKKLFGVDSNFKSSNLSTK